MQAGLAVMRSRTKDGSKLTDKDELEDQGHREVYIGNTSTSPTRIHRRCKCLKKTEMEAGKRKKEAHVDGICIVCLMRSYALSFFFLSSPIVTSSALFCFLCCDLSLILADSVCAAACIPMSAGPVDANTS